MKELRSVDDMAGLLDRIATFEGAATEYRIMCGRPDAMTAMQETLISDEAARKVKALQAGRGTEEGERALTESYLSGYWALHGIGWELADGAERMDIDATSLYAFLRSPDAEEGLQRAMIVIERLRARLTTRVAGDAIHSEDFTFVNWFGTEYRFAVGAQASAIKALWGEWERTGCGLHQQTIRDKVDPESSFRVDTAFRNHPALRTMIQRCGGGLYCLVPPPSASA